MDTACDYHTPYMKRENHSSQYLNHLSTANLNLQIPFTESNSFPESNHHVSYFESFSVPTTPSIFTRYPFSQKPRYHNIPPSKSSSHLHASKKSWSGITTPRTQKHSRATYKDEPSLNPLSKDKRDSDWLLRAGAFMSSLARESKGQSWLLPRASSISLTGRDNEEDEWVQEQSRERFHHGMRSSFMGDFSGDADDELSLQDMSKNSSFSSASRNLSQNLSKSGSRSRLLSSAVESESYFDCNSYAHEIEVLHSPDDCGIEISNSQNNTHEEDEIAIKMLAKSYSQGVGGWIEALLGWSLFSYDDEIEDIEPYTKYDDYSEAEFYQSRCKSNIKTDHHAETDLLSPKDDGASCWQDASWLLSIAAKVLF